MKNEYTVKDGVAYVKCFALGEDVTVEVDEDLLPVLDTYKGKMTIRTVRYKNSIYMSPYFLIEKSKTINLSHIIMGKPPKGYVVDHKDTNPLNNKRKNLRIITRKENSQNQQKIGQAINGKHSTGHLNVYKVLHYGKEKLRVVVQRNGKAQHLGFFDTIEEAIKVRDNFLDNGVNPVKERTMGVSFEKSSGKWRAYAYVNKVRHDLGRHSTKEEAIKARQDFITYLPKKEPNQV